LQNPQDAKLFDGAKPEEVYNLLKNNGSEGQGDQARDNTPECGILLNLKMYTIFGICKLAECLETLTKLTIPAAFLMGSNPFFSSKTLAPGETRSTTLVKFFSWLSLAFFVE
jgi:hypothetical protein